MFAYLRAMEWLFIANLNLSLLQLISIHLMSNQFEKRRDNVFVFLPPSLFQLHELSSKCFPNQDLAKNCDSASKVAFPISFYPCQTLLPHQLHRATPLMAVWGEGAVKRACAPPPPCASHPVSHCWLGAKNCVLRQIAWRKKYLMGRSLLEFVNKALM